jgi:phosphopantothenoylcysteine decarboxylase/phosphopantothenate--cysteine ligase
MRVIVTAGPTREYIDTVRFITNASSGQMGYAIAAAAVAAGHEVTLLSGPVSLPTPTGCTVVNFVSVEELKAELHKAFAVCDVLVMCAAVGDFRPDKRFPAKLRRSTGPVSIRLFPTEDILAGLSAGKRGGQIVISFAVEDGTLEQVTSKARAEMRAKGADYVVANNPEAMGASESFAAIFSAEEEIVHWESRSKTQLAERIVELLNRHRKS